MKPLAITDVEKMVLILESFSQLDDIRWSVADNYNLVNYSYDLTSEEELLTHWLCYITDRQTPFQRIWEVGGYVMSHIARAFAREAGGNVRELLLSYVRQKDGKLWLECPREATSNPLAKTRLARYGITGDKVRFASRYMPDDLTKIYRTLEILARHSEKSLASFIAHSFRAGDDYWHAVRSMATALDQLTYAVGKVSLEQFDQALAIIADEAAAFRLPSKSNPRLFGRKRLWCSLRDYLKSPEFNAVFVASLKGRLENPARWARANPEVKRALEAIELPGDVWNNAKVFRDGLFRPYLSNERASWDMPRTIRRVYELVRKEHDVRFYPEQLDVTFDFVPRMCQKGMCDVCLFGCGIDQVCHQKRGCLCPVALISCGYRHCCNPEACRLKEDAAKRLCHSSMTARDQTTTEAEGIGGGMNPPYNPGLASD